MSVDIDTQPMQDTAKVFLSYSRKDRERAQTIADVLRERHFGVFKDTDDILPTEEWKGRLEQLIAEADTIVFLLSPHSLASEVCEWEVEYARSLNKRIAPIVITEVDSGEIPPELARLNFIFCTERDRFQDAVDNLVSALSTDIEWVREHTRLGELARRWDDAGQPSRLLLRGQDIADAESWRDSRPAEAPAVTKPQAQFIAASRKAASRRQQIAVVSSVVGLVLALGLAGFAYVQREAAVESALVAARNEAEARQAQARAEQERNAAQVNQSLLLTRFADQELKQWLPVEAALLALEAMPDDRSDDPLRRNRPLVDEGQVMLRKALGEVVEDHVLLSDLPDSRFAISPDGRWLAVHAPNHRTLHVLDLFGDRPPHSIASDDATGSAKVPAFSPEASEFAVPAGPGGVLRVPVDPSKDPNVLKIGEGHISEIGYLNKGKELLAIDQSRTAVIVDLESGQTVFQAPARTMGVMEDGSRFALYHENRISIFNAADKGLLGATQKPLSENGAPVMQMVFSLDGRYLAAATEHRTFVVDGQSAGFVGRTGQNAQSLLDFGFDPSGDWHFVSGIDGKTTIYDLQSLSKVVEHTGQRGWIFDVAISADREHALTASSDANVKLWMPQSNKNVTWLRRHRGKVIQTAFIGAAQAVTLSEDGTLRQWNLSRWIEDNSDPNRETRIEGYSGDAVYTPDRSMVALSEAGIFNVESGDEVDIETRSGFDTVFRRFSDDGRWLLADLRSQQTGDTTNACLYDLMDGNIARCILPNDTGRISDTDMDASAQVITYKQVVGDDYDRHFVIVDARTGQERARRVEPYPNPHQQAAVIGPEGDRLFLQNGSHRIDVFDAGMQPVSSFGPRQDGTKLRFSADRRRVAFIWPAAGVLEVWDTQSETRISRIETPFPDSEATVFSPTGSLLTPRISATELAVYDVATGARVAQMQIRGRDFIEKPVFFSG